MSHPRLAHWIGGSWRPGESGTTFEARSFGGSSVVWPRAGAHDAACAARVAQEASAAWRALSRRERVARLRAWLEALASDGELAPAFERGFALDTEEASAFRERELFEASQALEIVADDVAERSGVVLFGAHWSDGAGRLAARAVGALAAGAVSIVVADGLFPDGPAALARAAERAELPAGVLGVLFDDGRTATDALLVDPRIDFARVGASEARLAEVARTSRAGLVLSVRPTVSRSVVLEDELDPVAAATSVLETSLSRLGTLSGQLPGRIGRVLCPRRHFSRFSEELLAAIDRHPDLQNPVPLIEPDALEALQEAWFLGLDEGATPLCGGPPWFVDGEGLGGGGPGRDRAGAPGVLRVRAVVFTNLDPRTRSGRFRRNVPALGLMRVEDARAGHELARRLDA